MEERFSHLVDLLEVKVVDFRTVKQHLTNICNEKAISGNRLHHFSISTNPEAMQGVCQVLFEVSTILFAMFSVVHSVVVKCALEETSKEIFEVKSLLSNQVMVVSGQS